MRPIPQIAIRYAPLDLIIQMMHGKLSYPKQHMKPLNYVELIHELFYQYDTCSTNEFLEYCIQNKLIAPENKKIVKQLKLISEGIVPYEIIAVHEELATPEEIRTIKLFNESIWTWLFRYSTGIAALRDKLITVEDVICLMMKGKLKRFHIYSLLHCKESLKDPLLNSHGVTALKEELTNLKQIAELSQIEVERLFDKPDGIIAIRANKGNDLKIIYNKLQQSDNELDNGG